MDVIEAVRDRAKRRGTRTDQADTMKTRIHSKASARSLAEAEKSLGFSLPSVLRRIYSEVGNGGFGPGYGLMGVPGGFTDDRGETCVSLYLTFAQDDPSDPKWIWPCQVVPICHWGCAIYSCVDCSLAEAPVYCWDPNEFESGTDPRSAIRRTHESLESWLHEWAAGADLWSSMFPPGEA